MCVLVYVTAYEFGGGGGVREERAGGEIAVARRDGERGGSVGVASVAARLGSAAARESQQASVRGWKHWR